MKEKIFEYMEEMGWRLDNFEDVLNTDDDTLMRYYYDFDAFLDKNINNEKPLILEKNQIEELRDAIGFISDFVASVIAIYKG